MKYDKTRPLKVTLAGCVGFLALMAGIVACDTPEQAAIADVERSASATRVAEVFVHSVKYVKDARTGFCFAYGSSGPHGIAMTLVPCSGEVEQLIKTNPK